MQDKLGFIPSPPHTHDPRSRSAEQKWNCVVYHQLPVAGEAEKELS